MSEHALSLAARSAINSSAKALGCGEDACFFCTLRLPQASGSADASRDETLQPADLFALIESLDPIVLIATDSAAARALSDAYRTSIAPLARSRVFGRSTVAFRSFEDMLATPDNKQRAWAILKLL